MHLSIYINTWKSPNNATMYKTSKNFKIFAEASSYVPVVFENFLINNHCQFFNMTTCNIKLPVLESEHSFRIAFNHGGGTEMCI